MILALDTATLQAGVALVSRDGRVLAERKSRVTTHSDALLQMVADVMADAKLAPDELDAIACGAGPGSFTGLRIGLATAKGLCLATGRPLIMVSSLQALARRAPAGCVAVACIDAFKGEVYAGFYRAGDEPTPAPPQGLASAELVLPPQRLLELLAEQLRAGPLCVLGDGILRFSDLHLLPGALAPGDAHPPDAADVGQLAARRFARGEFDDLAAAVPRYIRPSEAELKFGPPPAIV